jgi:hypothetical protein
MKWWYRATPMEQAVVVILFYAWAIVQLLVDPTYSP